MSITPKFMEKLRQRNNPEEIFYYAMRCLFNAGISVRQGDKKSEEEFLRQADELGAMLPKDEGQPATEDPLAEFKARYAKKAEAVAASSGLKDGREAEG